MKMSRSNEQVIRVLARLAIRGLPLKDRLLITKNIDKHFKELIPDIPEDVTTGFIAYTDKDKRVKIKTGRFFAKKLKLQGIVPDKRLQEIGEKCNLLLFPGGMFKICTGSEITENYENEVGGWSCMAGYNSDYTKLYEMNPDVYSQLVFKIGKNSARAMLVKLNDGRVLMDRIYTDGTSRIKSLMQSYADNAGYINPRSSYGTFTTPPLEFENGCVPYQDTLTRGVIIKGKLILSNRNGYLKMNATNGLIFTGSQCVACGCEVENEEAIEIDGNEYCNNCAENQFEQCEECNEYVGPGDLNVFEDGETVEHVCFHCYNKLKENQQCNVCYHWYSKDTLDNGICPDCAVEYIMKIGV